jgi:PAS domain S-box-containing protein
MPDPEPSHDPLPPRARASPGKDSTPTRTATDELGPVLDALDTPVLILDPHLRLRRYNASAAKNLGLGPADLQRDLTPLDARFEPPGRLLAEFARALHSGQPLRCEICDREGNTFLLHLAPDAGPADRPLGLVATFSDVSELRRMSGRLDLAIEASRLVWWEWDLTCDRLRTHSSGHCILDYPPDPLDQDAGGWLAQTHPDDRAHVRATLQTVTHGDAPTWDCEHRLRTRSGDWLWVANKGRVTRRTPDGKAQQIIGTTQDIHARKTAELTLARDLELLTHVPDAIICVDPSGIVTYWNHAATTLYGWSAPELIGRPLTDRFPAELRTTIDEQLRRALTGEELSGEFEDYRKDGSRVWVDARAHRLLDDQGRILGLMGISRDITERRRQRHDRERIEHQLAQSQKMETLGNLAGGIAHDFNNLLAAIIGYAEIASDLLPPEHPALAKLANVRLAGQRAAELVRRILAFSRAGEQPRRAVRVAQVIEETLPLLRAILPGTIEIRSRVAPDADHTVLGDATQIQQVLLNLGTNAAHALGDQPGAKLELALTPVLLAAPPPLHIGNLQPGHALHLTISDNGCGMTPEVLARAFEPFFTTKPVGAGTGLGLAIAQSIVTAHGGGILVDSQPGSGTTFHIYLPADPPDLGPQDEEDKPSPPSDPFPRGHGERIAVIDDEESVALLTQQALERYGYAARIMPDAPACLDILRRDPHAFALVVSDQTMPLMTGLELVQALRGAGLQTPVLLLSGYGQTLDPATHTTLGRVGFLAKPFVLSDLLEHVHAIVRASSPS